MKLSKEEADIIYRAVIAQQSLLLTIIGSIAGFSVGLGLFILFALIGATFAVTLFIPSIFVGFGAKFLGKPLEFKYRVIPGIFGMLIYAVGIYFVFVPSFLYLALTPVNFLIAYYFSKVKLNKEQISAVWQKGIE